MERWGQNRDIPGIVPSVPPGRDRDIPLRDVPCPRPPRWSSSPPTFHDEEIGVSQPPQRGGGRVESWRQYCNKARRQSSLGAAPRAKTWPPEKAQPATQATLDMADEPTMH